MTEKKEKLRVGLSESGRKWTMSLSKSTTLLPPNYINTIGEITCVCVSDSGRKWTVSLSKSTTLLPPNYINTIGEKIN